MPWKGKNEEQLGGGERRLWSYWATATDTALVNALLQRHLNILVAD